MIFSQKYIISNFTYIIKLSSIIHYCLNYLFQWIIFHHCGKTDETPNKCNACWTFVLIIIFLISYCLCIFSIALPFASSSTILSRYRISFKSGFLISASFTPQIDPLIKFLFGFKLGAFSKKFCQLYTIET